jgi:alkanesulfonate monooxygenase SsuD/methylene tetrahydromethanopterin reductase-like flavin-dependent oxidoreductase (luciferase family)
MNRSTVARLTVSLGEQHHRLVGFPLRIGIRPGPSPSVWRLAEEVGIDDLWVDDHFITMRHPEVPTFDSWTTLAAMSQVTKRVRLGVLVSANLMRHPALLAKIATTVDHLSNGRVNVGLAAAGNADEYARVGMDFPPPAERARRVDEACAVLRALWTEDRATFRGKYYRLTDAIAEPKPVQKPHPPLWVGGRGPLRTLRTVAKHADVWSTSGGKGFDADIEALHILEQHCRKLGRDPADIRRSVEMEWTEATEADVTALARRYIAAGFSDLSFSVGGYGESLRRVDEKEALRLVERFARGFVPSLRRAS